MVENVVPEDLKKFRENNPMQIAMLKAVIVIAAVFRPLTERVEYFISTAERISPDKYSPTIFSASSLLSASVTTSMTVFISLYFSFLCWMFKIIS